MKKIFPFLLLLLAGTAHAQSFTLKLSSCVAPSSPAKFLADGTGAGAHNIAPGGGIWAYLGYQGSSVTWMCSITVPAAGDYSVLTKTASIYDGATVHFESPANTRLGGFTIASNGSWFNYLPATTQVTLPSGQIPFVFVLDAHPCCNYATNFDDTLTFTLINQPPAPIFSNVSVVASLLWDDQSPVQGNVRVYQADYNGVFQSKIPPAPVDAQGNVRLNVGVNVQPLWIELRFDLTDSGGNVITTFQQGFPSLFVKALPTGTEVCAFTLVKGSNPVSLAKFPVCQP